MHDEQDAVEPAGGANARGGRARRVVTLLSGLFVAQSLVQLFGVLSGFLLLRWLDVDAFAQYSIAFGFAATLMILVDAGIGTSIPALIGERVHDREVVGAYVRTARHLRNLLVTVATPIAAVAFFVITAKYDWGLPLQLALFASVLATLFFRGYMDFNAAPLLLQQRFRDFYGFQGAANVWRVAVHALLYSLGALSSWAASLVNAVALALNGHWFRRRGRGLLEEPETADVELVREVRHYVAPLLPSLVFVAFQAQISIFVIGIFGETQQLAEVGALSRLGQVFGVFTALNGVLVGPYLARSAASQVPRRVALVGTGAAAVGGAVAAFAFAVPESLLWFLGPNYDDLEREVGWFVLGSALAFLSAVVYTMNTARKFVGWDVNNAGLVLTIVSLAVGAALFDVGTTLGVQYYFAFTNGVMLFTNLVTLGVGFVRGPRQFTPATQRDAP
jgi:O-antigen/teichoic acid export membrane protein